MFNFFKKKSVESPKLPQFRVRFGLDGKTVDGCWVNSEGKELNAWTSITGQDGRFGIEGEVYSSVPFDHEF